MRPMKGTWPITQIIKKNKDLEQIVTLIFDLGRVR